MRKFLLEHNNGWTVSHQIVEADSLESAVETFTYSNELGDNGLEESYIIREMSQSHVEKIEKFFSTVGSIGNYSWVKIYNKSSPHQEMYEVSCMYTSGPIAGITCTERIL